MNTNESRHSYYDYFYSNITIKKLMKPTKNHAICKSCPFPKYQWCKGSISKPVDCKDSESEL